MAFHNESDLRGLGEGARASSAGLAGAGACEQPLVGRGEAARAAAAAFAASPAVQPVGDSAEHFFRFD